MIEKSIEFDGLHYACKCWGDASSPTILALHGWLDNAASFDQIAPYLAKDYFLVAIDLPGHGHTDALPSGVSYHFLESVVQLVGLCHFFANQPEWGPVHRIMGHSMGGNLALLMSAMLGDQIQACVSIESLGPMGVPEEADIVNTMQKAVRAKHVKKRRTPPVYDCVEDAVKARLMGGFAMTQAAAKRICQRNLIQSPDGWVWRTDPRLRLPSLIRLTRGQVIALLQAITCSVLVIEAEQGLVQNYPDLSDRMSSIEKLQYIKVPGGHHAHMEDSAGSIAQHLQAFLANTTQ